MELSIIDNSKFIELFGTEKNKIYYDKYKKVPSSIKTSIMNRAENVCKIVEIGQGKYEILEIYDKPITKNYRTLHNTIYKYLTPIILNKVLSDYNNNLVATKLTMAKHMGMINGNYFIIKKFKTKSSEVLEVSRDIIPTYFDRLDRNIKYSLENALKMMYGEGLIEYDNSKYIKFRKCKDLHENSSIKYNFTHEHRIATDEEVAFYISIENKVLKKLGFENEDLKSLVFGSKSYIYKKALQEELELNPYIDEEGNKIVILLKYDGYRIWHKNIDKCKAYLETFTDNAEVLKLISNMNKYLIDKTIDNFQKDKIECVNLIDYETLAKVTLDYFADDLKIDTTPKACVTIMENGSIDVDIEIDEYNK